MAILHLILSPVSAQSLLLLHTYAFVIQLFLFFSLDVLWPSFCLLKKIGMHYEYFFQGLGLHVSEIEELCTAFPSTVVLLDHLGFTKPDE